MAASDSGLTASDSGLTASDSGHTASDSGLTASDSGHTTSYSGHTAIHVKKYISVGTSNIRDICSLPIMITTNLSSCICHQQLLI